MVRLYVGGLAAEITAEALQQRFVPFGAVQSCEVIPTKAGNTQHSPGSACRGFGYVDLDAKDDAALRRCLSQYNGCKWRGGVLRVEPAKVSFLETRKREREEDELAELEESLPAKAAASKDAHVFPFAAAKPLQLVRPDGKPINTEPTKPKTHFPLARTMPLEDLSWEPLPAPPGVLHRAAAEARAHAAAVRQAALRAAALLEDGDVAGPEVAADAHRGAEGETLKAAERKGTDGLTTGKKRLKHKERSLSPSHSDTSDSLAAVDFVSPGEAPVRKSAADLSRFDESDDDDGSPQSNAVRPAAKRRRGEEPGKAEKTAARKAGVAAMVDQIIAAKSRPGAKSLGLKKPTAAPRPQALAQAKDSSLAAAASMSSASLTSSSDTESSPRAEAGQAPVDSGASGSASDPEAEALWAARGGVNSYLAALSSEQAPKDTADTSDSALDGSHEADTTQPAGAQSLADAMEEDPEALWEEQGGLESYLAVLGATGEDERLGSPAAEREREDPKDNSGLDSEQEEVESEQSGLDSKREGSISSGSGSPREMLSVGEEDEESASVGDSDAEAGAAEDPAEEVVGDSDVSPSSSDDSLKRGGRPTSTVAVLPEEHFADSPPSAPGSSLEADSDEENALSSPAAGSKEDQDGAIVGNAESGEHTAETRSPAEQGLLKSSPGGLDGDREPSCEAADDEVFSGSADQRSDLPADGNAEDTGPNGVAGDGHDTDSEGDLSDREADHNAQRPILDSAYEGLEAGANFWAGGLGAEKLEAEWQASREQLASSWKPKRRDALRHAGGSTGKKKRH